MLRSLVLASFVTVLCLPASAQAQAPDDKAKQVVPTPVLDVSTFKPNDSASGSVNIEWNEATFRATNISIEMLLENAFDIRQDLTFGLPGWAKSAHYDVFAKVSDVDPSVLKKLTDEQSREMLQRLLVERFHLTTHIESKQLAVYNMVTGKDGIKFKEGPAKIGDSACKQWMSSRNSSVDMQCVPMESFAKFLSHPLQRTVIDKTGLPANKGYDFKLHYRPMTEGPQSDADLQEPTLFDALQEQLGLKLESTKGPVDTLVVDQIEKPTEN